MDKEALKRPSNPGERIEYAYRLLLIARLHGRVRVEYNLLPVSTKQREPKSLCRVLVELVQHRYL